MIRFCKILKINIKTFKISKALTKDLLQEKVKVPPLKNTFFFFFQDKKQIFDTYSPLTFFQPKYNHIFFYKSVCFYVHPANHPLSQGRLKLISIAILHSQELTTFTTIKIPSTHNFS